jgi:hypothetical protein
MLYLTAKMQGICVLNCLKNANNLKNVIDIKIAHTKYNFFHHKQHNNLRFARNYMDTRIKTFASEK